MTDNNTTAPDVQETSTVKRRPVSKRVRFEVFKRDKFKCMYCGQSAPDVLLHIDHIVPVSVGGGNDIVNLITSCADCNLGKSNILLTDSDAVKKQKAALDELAKKREQVEMLMSWKTELLNAEDESVSLVVNYINEIGHPYSVSEHGRSAVKRMVARFGVELTTDAFNAAYTQYYHTDIESWMKAFDYAPRIATVKKNDPKGEMRNVYYVRAILRNRLNYLNESYCIKIIREAASAGVSFDVIKELASEATSWTNFKESILEIVEYNQHGA